MTNDPTMIRAKRYEEIGRLIRSTAAEVLDKWSLASKRSDDQDSAKSAHQADLRNHLPAFLDYMGAELATHGGVLEESRDETARRHGKQRWELGWALDEVVRDYQLLRVALLDCLDQHLDRKLNLEEIKVIGVLLDDAIEDAVVTYVEFHQRHLAESEEQSRGTFENAAVGIGHVDQQGKWLRANGRLCDLLGYHVDELTLLSFDDCSPHTEIWDQDEYFDSLLNNKLDSFSKEIRLEHRDGHDIWAKLTASLQRSANRKPLYFILVIEDVSERRRLDEELEKARKKAEENNRLKSEFVANVSHEIRTPMNAILGMTELALDENISPLLRDYLTTAHESAKSLLALVNDLLDFSRMEAGKLELESAPFDLWQTIDETAKALSIRAAEKGLELLTDVAADVPRYTKGDSLRLRQVITNLVSNAVKFTERGEVLILAQLHAETQTHSIVRFAVRDTGIGISSEDKERIFAPFTQADASTTRVFGGSGLGLAICTELIGRLGGTLDVNSELGSGSEFFFTASFERADAPEELVARRQDRMEQLDGTSVLIVDDNATNRAIMEGILSRFGINVDSVDSGDSALSKIRIAAEAESPYDIVLVDALMPGTDGFAVIEQINNDEDLESTSVLMLSSADRSTFTDRAEHLSIDGYLDKPVTRRELLEVLSVVSFGAESNEEVDADVTPIPVSLNVLVAEDTPANQKVVQAILRKRGHNVTIANNGREAIDKLAADPYDLVLMDIQMPTVDGYQATTAIRELPDRAAIPIIAMTAHAMKGDADKCIESGMNDYISKPIDSRRLIELVERWGAGSQNQTLGRLTRDSDESHEEQSATSTQIVDFDTALKRLDGNEKLLRDMIGFFREDSPPLLRQIKDGLQSSNVTTARRAAHSLKGLASGFDAEQVAKLAFEIEQSAANQQFATALECFAELTPAVEKLIAAFDEYESAE